MGLSTTIVLCFLSLDSLMDSSWIRTGYGGHDGHLDQDGGD